MVELARKGAFWKLGYGGDTLNTAIHLARAGHSVGYLTALGADPFGTDLRQLWAAEGLDTSLVLEHSTRNTGLYAIANDPRGERNFSYWRDTSAAREMLSMPGSEHALAQAVEADLLAFSLITLAVLPQPGRERLLALASDVRARGGKVAFDGNFRARLWPDHDEAIRWRNAAIGVSDFGLPTLEDEVALSGSLGARSVSEQWSSLGSAEVVVKLGASGCYLPDGSIVAPEVVLEPVDTSGAGDAFNAGYLGARILGAAMADAACVGHAVAGWTIMRSGAIPARDS